MSIGERALCSIAPRGLDILSLHTTVDDGLCRAHLCGIPRDMLMPRPCRMDDRGQRWYLSERLSEGADSSIGRE